MLLKNSLKVAFLGLVGFLILVYLTAPEQVQNKKAQEIEISALPEYFHVSNNDKYNYTKELFQNNYLIVLNHDAIAVFNDLDKFTDKKIVLAANISKAPWFIKKLGVSSEINRMYKESKFKLIFDDNGDLIKTLGLTDTAQNSYNIYKINNNKLIFQSRALVKRNALQEGISKEEKTKYINELLNQI